MKNIMARSALNLFGATLVAAVSAQSFAQVDPSVLPPVPKGVNEDQIWEKYCVGNRKSPEIPRPNYKSPEVIAAARMLSTVSNFSFYYYSGPLRAYGLKKGREWTALPSDFPSDIVETFPDAKFNANAFLVQTCGEFRDRPTMIREKVKWATKIRLLPATPQQPIDPKKELWSQVSAHSYPKYIALSSMVFEYKKLAMVLAKTHKIQFGAYSEDAPVDGTTVCEVKHIFKNYIEKDKMLPHPGMYYEGMEQSSPDAFKMTQQNIETHWGEYQKLLADFEKSSCSNKDRNEYYDFRGDSNVKHYSPEANGMIWYSSSITGKCEYDPATKRYNAKQDFGGVDMCNLYFTQPFGHRWAAARAGLGAWLFRAKDLDAQFASQYTKVTILPSLKPSEKPFAFSLNADGVSLEQWDLGWSQKLPVVWKNRDMGFNSLMKLSPANDNAYAYERLRDAVNRHTNWYQSSYNDGMGLNRDQAYSPFVASSYEMSKSDGFTAPGMTVQAPADGCKHWMFVFRVKKDNWYTTASLKAGKKIDFNRHWIDETSFGTDSLADHERAWDRLGTALEGEFDSMLYLHNLTNYGSVDPNACTPEKAAAAAEAAVQPAISPAVMPAVMPAPAQ